MKDRRFQRQRERRTFHAVSELLKKSGEKGIAGIGPINPKRTSCKILLAGEKGADVPSRLHVTLPNKKDIRFGIAHCTKSQRPEAIVKDQLRSLGNIEVRSWVVIRCGMMP